MKRRALATTLLATVVSLALIGCYAREGEPVAAAEPDRGQPLQFTFGTLEGGELSSDTTRGRTTVLLFVATYDLPSQAEAQLLREVLSKHKPLANAGIVMLEPPRSAPLAQVWAEAIDLKLPIAMATPTLMSGDSQLGRVAGVPTLIVLDRRGRLVGRVEGALGRDEISAWLDRADAR